MRQYEPIWVKLKSLSQSEASSKGVSITAPRALHRRIIKAVKKEKWMDIAYKLEIEPRVAVLSHSQKNSILTFQLSFSLIATDF
jgi:hypothetical protein